ncbi:MAG TPA: HEAT repeat domain-containing protein [Anaerolineaceae bacterium]|nr:HEAT repeat domain-containing protein [Anaerolineaceae bacterium]
MPGTHDSRALTILLIFLLASLSAAGCGLVMPSQSANPPVASFEATASPSLTMAPEDAPIPFATLSSTPTPTVMPATPTPGPAFDKIRYTFETAVATQITHLLQSGVPAPSGFQMPPPDQRQIILLPNNERLYYLQGLLSPQIDGGGANAPLNLYVIYWYERGHDLFYQSAATFPTEGAGVFPAEGAGVLPAEDSGVFPASQTLTIHIQLVGTAYGHAYTFEGITNDSGNGSQNDRDMLQKAVLPLQSLGDQAEQVQSAIELITGYGMGLDWDTTIQPQVRVDLLRPALQSENWSDRLEAAQSLQKLGSAASAAVPDLIKAMEVEEDQFLVAQGVLKALAAIQPDILPMPINLTSSNPLEDILADKNNIPVMAKALASPAWETRALAAVILSRWGDDAVEAIPALVAVAHDPNPHVRSAVVSALGQVGANIEAVVPVLIQAQSDDMAEVRQSANRVFRYDRSQAQTVVPALIQALGDTDITVRLTAIQSLQWLGRDADLAIPPLIKTMKDPDAGIRAAAALALYYITNQGFGDDVDGWQNWWQQELDRTTTPQPTPTDSGVY